MHTHTFLMKIFIAIRDVFDLRLTDIPGYILDFQQLIYKLHNYTIDIMKHHLACHDQ